MTLTLDEVRKTKFHMARRTGYEVSEVDLFVDRVEASFAQLTEENHMLKQQVEALKQAQTRQREERSEPSNEELRQQRQPEQSQ
ncbi:MAG: DivIVA domain-containing protein, partial [Propionibacteriaceae bacterium]|nr:DivIVA domain-containing protein [Propionibacteriaceae bacterium]